MIKIKQTRDEVFFAAGRDVEDARARWSQDPCLKSETPSEAWEELNYWDRQENYEEFEVFEFRVSESITKVEPPYLNHPQS